MENWKDIPEFNYQISDYGNIRSKKTGRILIKCNDKDGYHLITLCKGGKQWTRKVHRLVAQIFIENPNNLSEVNHIDGDKKNNVVYNLEWVSRLENERHAYETGIKNIIGINNPNYKHGKRMKQL